MNEFTTFSKDKPLPKNFMYSLIWRHSNKCLSIDDVIREAIEEKYNFINWNAYSFIKTNQIKDKYVEKVDYVFDIKLPNPINTLFFDSYPNLVEKSLWKADEIMKKSSYDYLVVVRDRNQELYFKNTNYHFFKHPKIIESIYENGFSYNKS